MMNLTNKERGEQFILLTSVYVTTITLLGLALFYRTQRESYNGKEQYSKLLVAENAFEKSIAEEIPKVDSLSAQIIRYSGNVNAAFLEDDIKYGLNEISSDYQRLKNDRRYIVLYHVHALYNTLFINRRELEGNMKDIEGLNQSWDDCKHSTRQLRESLTRESLK